MDQITLLEALRFTKAGPGQYFSTLMRIRYPELPITICAIFLPSQAVACSMCVIATSDFYLPPISLWMWIATVWFLSSGIIKTSTKIPSSVQPGITVSILILIVAAVIGMGLLGPIPLLLLALPPGLLFIQSFRSMDASNGRRAIRITGILHLIALAVAVVFAIHIRATRTDAEFISKWGYNGISGTRVEALRSEEPKSLPDYRYIMTHTEDRFIANRIAERLAEIGLAEDLPLLDSAAARFNTERIKQAKETLTKRLKGAANKK